ncbi:unnamed protein product [Calypogeia fissa]
MNGTARLFWKLFVEQARHLLDIVSQTDIDLFNDGADIIVRIEGLYTYLTATGEVDEKYKQFLEPAYIADLFYADEKILNFREVIRLLPSHIYHLPGRGSMTKTLVREVGVHGHALPKNPEAEPMEGIAAEAGEGTSTPHLVGLPSLVAVVVQASEAQTAGKEGSKGKAQAAEKEVSKGKTQAAAGGTPTVVAKTTQKRSASEVRGPPKNRSSKTMTVESGRPASPPQTMARSQPEDDGMEVVDSRTNSDLSTMRVNRMDLAVVDRAQHEQHQQFWADMGLRDFAALNWGCSTGSKIQCREFMANYEKEHSTSLGYQISLSESSLATIFKLGGAKDRQASLRAKQWQSQKFSDAKEKNGYKWNQCTDPLLVERLEFMRVALYMQEKKTTVSASLVREAEQVLGSSTNWAKHFHKQFHQQMTVARISKRTLLGSHIRLIFHWVKQQRLKGLISPLPTISSPSAEPLEQYPEELLVANGNYPEGVAQATKSSNGKAKVGTNEAAQGNDTTMESSGSEGLTLIEIFPKRQRRGVASRINSPKAGEPKEDHQEKPSQEDNHVEIMEVSEEEEEVKKSPLVQDGPHLPHYLRRVVSADHHGSTRNLASALEVLSARAFCEEFIEGTLMNLRDHSAELFTYVQWLARTVKEQRTHIKELVTQMEQIANVDEYDKLVKEKASWFSTRKQLEDDLQSERGALQQVIKERDDGRFTLAKNAEVIQKNAQILLSMSQDRSKLQVNFTRVTTEKEKLHETVARLKSNIIDLEKLVTEALQEKNDVLQDMENAEERTEALLQRLALLEALASGTPDPLGKRQ